jgi:hypothetical protein
MADQSVALQIKTPDMATPLREAQDFEAGQTNLAAGQTKLQMLNRQNSAEEMQFNNQQIANAAARGIDSDAWDAQFQRLADQGVPGAEQFLKRYSPVLQQRVLDSYGAAQPTTSQLSTTGQEGNAATQTSMFDRIFNGVPTPKLAQSLQKNNTLAALIPTIHDQQSLTEAIRQLDAIGIQNAAQILGGPQWSPLVSPTNLNHVLNTTQGMIGYLQNRVAGASTGVPNPPVKNDVTSIGDVGYSVDPYKGTATQLTPGKPQKIGTNEYGLDIYGVPDPNAPGGFRRIDAPGLSTGSPQAGGTVSIEEAAKRIQPTENTTGNPAATNPRSSAMGNDQFTEKTWLSTIKTANLPWTEGLSDKQLLALRAVPGVDSAMTVELAKQNAPALAKAGLPVTTATIALAHKFGLGDATKILTAPQTATMEDILPAKVIDANPELKGQTAGAYAQGLARKVGNNQVNIGAPDGTTASALAVSSAPAATGTAGNLDLHGEDYLKTLAPEKAGIVRQIVEGRSEFPSGFIMKTPYGQWLSQAVAQAEPGFTAADFNMRKAVVKEWNAGGPNSPAGILTAGNTAIQHLGKLSDAAEKLENWSGWGALNGPLNWATLKEREISQDPRVSNFDSIRNKYIEEATKFYRGTGGTEADLQRDIQSLNAAQSPEQLRQAVATQSELMQSKINALQDRWTKANTLHDGRVIESPFPIVQKQSQSAIDKIKSREDATGSAPASGGQTPTVDPRDSAELRANSHDPAFASAIDKKYGTGTAARLLGQ